ncbi:MAG: DUF370 domain-containing protein [Clostridiales bacterium]|nr:DUF370 domain-containing protein [Candidatus Apopatocola equi]MCQ2440043.1 DUF370 domain-containing protein [Oscillospiraceae bacterium]
MYLHLGGDTVVECGDIVGIFDLDNTTASLHTRRLLSRAQKNGAVIAATDDIPRSVVLCTAGGQERVYLSLLSTAALLRRLDEEPWK